MGVLEGSESRTSYYRLRMDRYVCCWSILETVWAISTSKLYILNKPTGDFPRVSGEGPYLIFHSYSQTFCFPPRTLLELPSPIAVHVDDWSRRGESSPLSRSAGDVRWKGFICINCNNENICGYRNEIPPVNLSPFSGQHFWRLALSICPNLSSFLLRWGVLSLPRGSMDFVATGLLVARH